ncbi:inositol-pentakisphosphate 2-kinase [Crepidotus variabilis]|uniref:Inositol-pentakisphosphate 2-kinase n=1 Tax=Crepidotus variabilis TaxID=179855 RepID=A0A9P6JNQ4_9AGAR|nr:inositol-pentakisphosphate 2-kinase [Crepidotus variabilis]
MPDVLHTDPSDWKYVSEGGATIVYSYKGATHADFDGTVLRLRKAPVGMADTPSTSLEGEEDPDDPTIAFQTKCMERLIPPEHLPRLVNVHLNRTWLEKLVEMHDRERPELRRAKDAIDLNKHKGVLATDLVGGNRLAVEIKPKWAFLPSPVYLSQESKHSKTNICRFCMHSQMRAARGLQAATDYCPLDLFSGREERVLRAIRSLWQGWITSDGAANNLKIFASGKFIRPIDSQALLADGCEPVKNMDVIRDAFAAALVQPLLETPVLRILSRLQRNLDVLDIEGLSDLWRRTESAVASLREQSNSVPPPTPIGGSSPFFNLLEPRIPDWTTFLDNYISLEKQFDASNPTADSLRHYILAYLLSATFKDCSIIVRLKYLQPGTVPQQVGGPQSVAIIDLDPKSMSKLGQWEKLDREIVASYKPVEGKVCVDDWQPVM